MATINEKTMLDRTNLTHEAFGAVVSNDVWGLIKIDSFEQFNEKYVEGLCRVLQMPVGTAGGVSNTGVLVLAMAEDNQKVMIY